MFSGLKSSKEKKKEDPTTEYADWEICRKSQVGKFIQEGTEFYIADMDKKKLYCSSDLRLKEISEKLDKETTFVFKEARYV